MIDAKLTEAVLGLQRSIRNRKSVESTLAQWSRLVRLRDANRCVLCDATSELAAHHICRKSFLPSARFDTGNGITLCRACHKHPHAKSNRRPNLELPMDEEGGEKIELLWELYEVLLSDAVKRSMLYEELYSLSPSTLQVFRNLQGIDTEATFIGGSLQQACAIWRQTPRHLMDAILGSLGIRRARGLVQSGPVMLFVDDDEST